MLDTESVLVLEETVSAPEPLFGDESSGWVELEASPGAAAWRRRLAPRHRGAVRRFFAVQSTRTPDSGIESSESGPKRDAGTERNEDRRQ